MDRTKHRRIALAALVLFACGVILVLHWQPMSVPKAAPDRMSISAVTSSEPQEQEPNKIPSQVAETATPDVSAPQSAPALTGFRGQVLDAVTRQPIKEFEIQLIHILRQGINVAAESTSRNFKSPTGRFIWTDVAAGTWRAAVSAPGYQMFNVSEFQISDGELTREAVMPLLRGFAVRGRVYDLRTGAGIADAWISFRPANEEENFFKSQAQVRSKDDGSFTLDGIPAGDILLRVGAQDHAFRELPVAVDEKTPAQEVALSTGATVAGTVSTTAGAPVKGEVSLSGPGPGYMRETNEAGQFSFNHMPPGRYRVWANTNAGSAIEEFTLENEDKLGINLVVGAGHSIRGKVRGLPAEQLPSTFIMLHRDSAGAPVSARPNEQGSYALQGVPAGHAVMTVSGGGLQFRKPVDMPADQDLTVDIVFPTGARLSGRVTQGGKPAASKNVWMRPLESKSDMTYRAITSADGLYEIAALAPGDYRLRADDDIARVITLSGDTVLNIDIPSTQLSVRVVEGGNAAPIVDANVHIRGTVPETARVRVDKPTDDFGQVAITGLEPGEIVLIVYKSGYEMHREKIAYSEPITDKTITLRKSAGVEVRVKSGSRRFPRGFTLTQSFPGNEYVLDLWMPLDRDGLCHVPEALKGTTFQIGRFSGEPIVIEDWDGQPFELP